ncbi:MAG: monofunctional biosynthetic peptidoglycan transglycosylase [Alphaproteobacteria bacterium]|nr:monofunctional biosynthetic peptidoglycan transglycosylase [Alphaproteobacteria bacterium]
MLQFRRLVTFLKIALQAIAILFVVSLIWGRVLPIPSTLIIGHLFTGNLTSWRWVSIESISPALSKAVIASEDHRFCTHWGVDFIELQSVLSDRGGPSRGASTISMQVAKNLYLWPGRSYIRKALELPLALLIDLLWGKKRMMEIYLNIAEWGRGIFGAEAAAQFYFKKPASELTNEEAARLAASLPNPIRRNPARIGGSAARVAEKSAGITSETACLSW